MSHENVQTTNNIYEEFNQRNYSAVLEFFAPNFEWFAADHSPLADSSPYLGLDAVRKGVFDRIADSTERIIIKPDEIFDADDKVVMLGYYDLINKAAGKPYQAQVAHVWTFNKEGKAVKFQQYLDTFQIAESARQNTD